MSASWEPLVETDEVAALREDYARLRIAFAEALNEERQLNARLAAAGLSPGPATKAKKGIGATLAKVRQDLDRALLSRRRNARSAVTALFRGPKDRRTR